jgi:hypothetical protein
MAWTDIDNALVSVGALPFATTIQALRDNPIAIANGDLGATRIVGAGAKRLADYPALSISASDDYSISILVSQVSGSGSTISTTFVDALTITIDKASGTARFRASHRTTSGSYTSTLQLVKNGTVVTTFTTTSTTDVERSLDVAVAVSDVFKWQHKISSDFAVSTTTALAPKGTDTYVTRPLYIKATDINTA